MEVLRNDDEGLNDSMREFVMSPILLVPESSIDMSASHSRRSSEMLLYSFILSCICQLLFDSYGRRVIPETQRSTFSGRDGAANVELDRY